MYRILGADGQKYGPVTADTLREWIVEKRVHNESLVHIEGEEEWRELVTLPEFAATLNLIECKVCQTPLARSAEQCPQCGQHWPTLYVSCPYCDESDFEVVATSGPWFLVPASFIGVIAYAIGSVFFSAGPKTPRFQCNRCGGYFKPPRY